MSRPRSSVERGLEPADDAYRLQFMARPPEADEAVIFLHGLNGHYWRTWGEEGSPGTFIRRVIEDLPRAAVGAFDYPARLFGFVNDETLNLEGISRVWADHLAEAVLGPYRRVGIVGYCLGGLITTLALRRLIAEERLPPCRLVAFLLDVPHDWPESHLGIGNMLRIEVATLRENGEFWRRQPEEDRGLSAYALVSSGDSWVSPLNPRGGLPEDRVLTADVSHTRLPQPPAAGSFAPYDFVLEHLKATFRGPSPLF